MMPSALHRRFLRTVFIVFLAVDFSAFTFAAGWAQGGAGGFAQDGNGRPAWAGGTGWTGMAGTSAQNAADDGGGGGAAGSGPGGTGSKDVFGFGGGNGGVGGANGNGAGVSTLSNTGSLTGGNGGGGASGDALTSNTGGGGGGAGGYGAVVNSGGASFNAGSIVAGSGGSGGGSQGSDSGGGFGGSGGVGVQFATGGVTFTNSGSISGGNGGAGGTGHGALASHGGGGGNGGIGVNFSGTGNTLINTGSIVGGAGAGGGSGSFFGGTTGRNGAGGIGVMGAGLAIVNSGTIAGGGGANAITFTGGVNSLTLQPGSTILGNVAAFSAADTLALGGSSGAGATFDVTSIGPSAQYQNFGVFQVNSGNWTLVGSTSATTNWQFNGGVVSLGSDAALGAPGGSFSINGATLQTTASFSSARNITLGSSTATIAPVAGTALTLTGNINGPGGLTLAGPGTLILSGASSYGGPTNIQGGTLRASGSNNILSSTSAFTVAQGGVLDIGGTAQTIGSLAGSGTVTNSGFDSAVLTTGGNNSSTTFSGNLQDGGAQLGLLKVGSGTMTLTGVNSYSGGTTVQQGTLVGNSASLQGNILNNASVVFDQATNGTYSGFMSGSGSLTKTGAGTLYLFGPTTYSGATSIANGRLQAIANNVLSANSAFTIGPGAVLDIGPMRQTIGSLAGSGTVTGTGLLPASLNAGGNGASTVFSGSLQDGVDGTRLALVKAGAGTLNLIGSNSYSGGTTVSGGILQGNSNSLQGSISNQSLLVFHQDIDGTYAGSLSGPGALHVRGGRSLTLTGNSSNFTGPTSLFGTKLVVNGSLGGTVTADSRASIGGTGSIGGLVSNGATLQPGNSIGTLSVTGALVQNGGTYQLELNGQGQSDRINVGGTAQLNGGTVLIQPAQGSYASSTTYTILNAAGGLSGNYAGISHNFAFLTPSLSYDANNAYLTLALVGPTPFSGGGGTPNQQAAGSGLDQIYATATGDMATVIGALAGLQVGQGAAALEALSGQPWADMGTMNLAGASLFLNAVGQQMAVARGSATASGGARQALAQACDVAACDPVSPFSIWASGLGGFGAVAGNTNAATLTYNQFGGAAGVDYRLDPRFVVGLGVGYASGTMWANNFPGNGWTSTVSAAAYASFTQAGFYADLLAGYGYATNQMQRQIVIPNLQPRTASGSTGANQFLGQAEIGFAVPVYAPAQASLTPFARFQAVSSTENGFSEWGANSISLNIAQQTTNALRSTLGADLAGAIPLGEQRQLDLALRLGWMHDYAYLGRPMTAAFAGAPSAAFTVYGATPPADYAVIALSAGTKVADSTQLYLRYDGQLATGADNHAVTAGVRITW